MRTTGALARYIVVRRPHLHSLLVIDGVSVTITPMPGRTVYQAVDGRPSTTLTATVLPFAHAFALNASRA